MMRTKTILLVSLAMLFLSGCIQYKDAFKSEVTSPCSLVDESEIGQIFALQNMTSEEWPQFGRCDYWGTNSKGTTTAIGLWYVQFSKSKAELMDKSGQENSSHRIYVAEEGLEVGEDSFLLVKGEKGGKENLSMSLYAFRGTSFVMASASEYPQATLDDSTRENLKSAASLALSRLDFTPQVSFTENGIISILGSVFFLYFLIINLKMYQEERSSLFLWRSILIALLMLVMVFMGLGYEFRLYGVVLFVILMLLVLFMWFKSRTFLGAKKPLER